MKNNQPQNLPAYPAHNVPNTQDEISLVDIWLTFRKRRKLFLITAITIILLGLALALAIPKYYGLNTSMEIGSEIRGDTPTPIESPAMVKAKLESSLIPLVKNELNTGKDKIKKYKIKVNIPKGSELVVLSSKTSKKDEGIYRELHNKILDAIIHDHAKLTNMLKRNLQSQLALSKITLDEQLDPATLNALVRPQEKILADAKADLSALSDPDIFGVQIKVVEGEIQGQKIQLAALEDQAIIIDQQLKQINTNQELITTQIKELEFEIQDAVASNKSSRQDSDSEAPALAQLMFGNETQQNRQLLAELKERLLITLENKKVTIQKSMKGNKRAQDQQLNNISAAEARLKELIGTNLLNQDKLRATIRQTEADIAILISAQKRSIATEQNAVDEIQAKLDNFVGTRAVIEPTLSVEPVSISRLIMLLISMFVGGVFGIIAVYFAELREKVKEATP